MPLTAFIHPITRQRVEFDAFDADTSRLGRPAFPPWMAAFIARKEREDIRHSTPALTVTRCLTCPRETFIETLLSYAADPAERFTMDRGSALHAFAADNWPEGYISEATHRGQLTVSGKLFGVPLSAQLDALRVEAGRPVEIIDLKFPSDWSVKWRGRAFADDSAQWTKAIGRIPQPTPKLDHAVQLNVQRLLLGQQQWALAVGYDADTVDMTLWDHATGSNEGPVAFPIPRIDEAAMLEVRPGGGRYTVAEIVAAHAEALARYEAEKPTTDEARERICASLPLVGAAGMFGDRIKPSTKCVQYCAARGVCDRLVRDYGADTTVAADMPF